MKGAEDTIITAILIRVSRPISVCWCDYLPKKPVDIKTNIYILQHPFEESRKLKTAPMLFHSLPEGKCHIIRGKRFTDNRYPELIKVFQSTNTYLLYPAPGAPDITELPPLDNGEQYNLIVIDGTWSQAKGIYLGNNTLQQLKKVQIKHSSKSKYIIRTQPTDSSLSTLECVAIALEILEQKPDLHEFLSRPLEALCKFQMNHGAVVHHSKVYKIENGLWKKPLPKKLLRKLEKEKLFEGEEECS
ncbi:hypothetical protein ACJMK2_043933 [Sinanodonta woodiana]|uniref:tRNA-uridine aminocarboxypropyltransferase n=1 Tax=Sinanodonta woodiana TaxID=1069815 RepID=A0ABD3W219_SINWO